MDKALGSSNSPMDIIEENGIEKNKNGVERF